MRVEVLHVADCPSLPVIVKRIAAAVGDRDDVTVTKRLISDDTDAAHYGMTGSPTVLVDGKDPFAGTVSRSPSVSCRLYRDETDALTGAPSLAQLREALTA